MATINEFLYSPAAQALGWTLVHSLWQGLLCMLLAVAVLRVVPNDRSAFRYVTSVVVFALLLLSSVVTFCLVYERSTEAVSPGHILFNIVSHSYIVASEPAASTAWNSFVMAVNANIGITVVMWLLGTVLFALRIAGGYWYVGKVRRSSLPVSTLWEARIQALAMKLNIRTKISVAQSHLISAPVVMGYLKPVILVPVGMFSGLSTEQLESIFIHELLHIRRGDYLVNIVQSVLEALYFFNPFAWMISSMIRREREHCCDDGVVKAYGNAMAYVRALAVLEEAKLSRTGVALSLADNKNQLLNRIKRIMERSVQRYSGRERIVPAVLLVVGLMCASWLTIQSSDAASPLHNPDERVGIQLPADTTKKERSGTYYRYRITTVDENGEPDVHVVEGFEGDEEMRDGFADMPGIMDIPEPVEPIEPVEMIEPRHFGIAPVPPVPVMDFNFAMPVPPVAPFDFHHGMSDTLMPGFHHRDWEEFGRAFEETFRERFGDFYEQHEGDIKEMMKAFGHNFGVDEQALLERAQEQALRHEDFIRDHAAIAAEAARAGRMTEELAVLSERGHEEQRARLGEAMRSVDLAAMHAKMDRIQRLDMGRLNEEMSRMEARLKDMEKDFREAHESLRKELVNDGYLKSDETIKNINVSGQDMEVNGKKIKPADAKRYRGILDKAKMNEHGRKE